MRRPALHAVLIASICASATQAQDKDCLMGDVTFITGDRTEVLNLEIHERRVEVPKGLYRKTELPEFGGVLAIYPANRDGRSLMNTNLFPADMMSFDDTGKTINLMVDDSAEAVDRFPAGTGMRFAAYLAGGTIKAKGFTTQTVIFDVDCTEAK
jgi:hypothetical protein